MAGTVWVERARAARRGAMGAVCAAALTVSVAARADVDLTGNFVAGSVIVGFPIMCTLDIVQTATALSVTGSCDFVGAISLSGTIDPMTGVLTASGSAAAICTAPDSLVVAATATLDSSSFSGTFTCGGFSGSLFASRCGNGQPDPGEACDLGVAQNGVFGSCCSALCQYQPASTMCRSPFECDPAEFCTGSSAACPADVHTPDGTPCADSDCVTGRTCSGGVCGGGTPLPAGTSCGPPIECAALQCDGSGTCEVVFTTDPCDDGDACTTNDACADGFCTGGPALDCGPCQSCDSVTGCFPAIDPTCRKPLSLAAQLIVGEGASSSKNKIIWKWKDGAMTPAADFGDPRTTTSYTLCVYDQDPLAFGGLRLALRATAAAGGNWSPTATGFRYKDATLSPDGVRKILLKSGEDHVAQIVLTGKHGNLHLAPLLAQPPLTVQLKASNGQCWDATYPSADTNTPVRLKATGGP